MAHVLKMEYILLFDLNFYKIPIQSDGHGFDRVLLEICPPGGWRAYGEVGGINQGIVDGAY